MEDHIKLHHNFTDGKPSEIYLRTGDAPNIYDPTPVNLEGVITAPAEYLLKRPDQVPPKVSYLVFNKSSRTIKLVINESDKFKTTVQGSLRPDKFLSSLNINSTSSYSISDLLKTIRFAARHFADKESHKNLVLALRNFTTKITLNTSQENDMKGNKKQSFESKVEEFAKVNELGFVLSRPLFEGMDKQAITITVEIDVINSQVALFLVCDELEELYDNEVERVFSEQKEVFANYVCIDQF